MIFIVCLILLYILGNYMNSINPFSFVPLLVIFGSSLMSFTLGIRLFINLIVSKKNINIYISLFLSVMFFFLSIYIVYKILEIMIGWGSV